MSFIKKNLVLLDYEYMRFFMEKEQFTDNSLKNFLERICMSYDLGIVGFGDISPDLQKKK